MITIRHLQRCDSFPKQDLDCRHVLSMRQYIFFFLCHASARMIRFIIKHNVNSITSIFSKNNFHGSKFCLYSRCESNTDLGFSRYFTLRTYTVLHSPILQKPVSVGYSVWKPSFYPLNYGSIFKTKPTNLNIFRG